MMKNIKKWKYKKILKEIFKPKTMIHIFEYLDIHRMQIGIYSYINLLLFIKEHDNSKLLNMKNQIFIQQINY